MHTFAVLNMVPHDQRESLDLVLSPALDGPSCPVLSCPIYTLWTTCHADDHRRVIPLPVFCAFIIQ